MKLFLSPHSDDETLFGAFTIMRERPLVVVVYDGFVQANRGVDVSRDKRRAETFMAMTKLDARLPCYLGLRDDQTYTPEDVVFRLRDTVDAYQTFDTVYAPIWDADGHEQHNVVSLAAELLKSVRQERYSTYTRGGGRQRTPNEVLPADGSMIARKHAALACYASQMDMNPKLGTWSWFVGDLREYLA